MCKNLNTYYIVSIADYEYYSPIILFGPKVKQWKLMCDNIMKNILSKSISKQITSYAFKKLLIELESRGYKSVNFPEAGYFEGNSISDL
jgi:hypothetical protein